MADPLYLSIWFPSFGTAEMMPRLVSVLRQFPFSVVKPGITSVEVHPVNWSEPTILERRFRPGLDPEAAAAIANDLLHEDYAYVLEAAWDLWSPIEEGDDSWVPQALAVRFIAQGPDFDQGTFQETGHIQADFGMDTPFLYDEMELSLEAEARVRTNISKLVGFTSALEKNCGITGRVLWSESEENLAQKLISRLQKVQ